MRNLLIYIIYIGIYFIGIRHVYAQTPTNSDSTNFDFIYEKIENMAENTDSDMDYSDLVKEYINLFKNPVNINDQHITKLSSLYLISSKQVSEIIKYKKTYGNIYSKFELLEIPGFNRETVVRIEPFITFQDTRKSQKELLSNTLKRINHELIFRMDRILEKKKGYSITADSGFLKPGSIYLGDPYNIYLRYSLRAGKKIRFGITVDKDAGEIFPFKNISDTVRNLTGDKIQNIPDFYSAYFSFNNLFFFENITIGDFHAEFGQGLTIWSGLSFGKSANGNTLQKYGRGIRPNTSTNENRYLRGISTVIAFGKLKISCFGSINKIDANMTRTGNIEEVTSFQESGLHRTINELYDKRSIDLTLYGANVNLQHDWFSIGITASNSRINIPIKKPVVAYKYYDFYGNILNNIGLDFVMNRSGFTLYGESTYTSNNGFAFLAGLNAYLNDRLTVNLNYHNYGKEYFSFMNNAISSGSNGRAENGIYIGYNALISKNITLSGYADFTRFTWLRFQSSFPQTNIKQYVTQLDYLLSSNNKLSLRYRYKRSYDDNKNIASYFSSSIRKLSQDLRATFKFHILSTISLKTKLAYNIQKYDHNISQSGYLLSQQISLTPEKLPLSLIGCLSIFNISDYDARIYSYENDVLYSFSVPAYYGNGNRWYILLKWQATKFATIWFRVARTKYFDRNEIGSGGELIDGSSKTEIKFQTKIKL